MLLLACGLASAALAVTPPPWSRTETREPCASSDPLRRPYFGDLHIHTAYSVDAYLFGTRVDPTGAFAFVRGGTIPLADTSEEQTRSAQLDRPLDFAAVTDHGEWFGEASLCTTEGSPVYDEVVCQQLRQKETTDAERFFAIVAWQVRAGVPPPVKRQTFCDIPGIDCAGADVSVWQSIQAAAEGAYDRTAACGFTSFVGFEYTPSPLGRHQHRNVVFRNATVPAIAPSYLQTGADGVPQGFWHALERDCLDAGTGCDVVAIPHNSNLSGAMQFTDPLDAADARTRQIVEPLAEIHQIKGNSECRFDRMVGAGIGTADEQCDFEQLPLPHEFPGTTPPAIADYPPRNMVRNALKDGLGFEQTLGVNPFKFGFVGGGDNHNAAGGSTDEGMWEGGGGANDATPELRLTDGINVNPGGLAVAWAEENSRDAIFSALKRRETYATSGTRPVVRFFAGRYPKNLCKSPERIRQAYARGTPMGGDIGAAAQFLVLAAKDPGTVANPGTDLQRIQIVKGWVDAQGVTHEKTFDVAGDPANGAGVDPQTCAPTGTGASELCAVWHDPSFRPGERAFYYARVLENPTCRWHTRLCKKLGIDPFAADCATQAANAGPDYANCCLRAADQPSLSPVIQERAWTSPIWYRPEAVRRLEGRIRFGKPSPGDERLDLRLAVATLPAAVDPTVQGVAVQMSDDDPIVALQLAAGEWKTRGGGWAYRSADGVVIARLDKRGKGAVLRVRASRQDLSHADAVEHLVNVVVTAGPLEAAQTRLWTAPRGGLRVGSGA